MTMSRELMGKIVDDVFDGAIEDPSVIEQIYASIKKHEAPAPSPHVPASALSHHLIVAAISAATEIDDDAISISVSAFRRAWDNHVASIAPAPQHHSNGSAGWSAHDLIPGRAYESIHFGTVKYNGLDTYHGQTTHEFSTHAGLRHWSTEKLGKFLRPKPSTAPAQHVILPDLTDEQLQKLRELIDNAPPGAIQAVPAPQHHVATVARAFMDLFVVESGDDRGLSVDDIDMTELTHRYAALEAAMAGTPAPQEHLPVDAPIVFGLEAQGHIPTVEAALSEGADWQEIGRRIGWDGETAKAYYERHLARAATAEGSP